MLKLKQIHTYLVVALRQQKVFWFVNRDGKFEQTQAADDGFFQAEVFPGLWLDPAALIRLDGPRLLDVLRQGCAADEHAAFAKRLSS